MFVRAYVLLCENTNSSSTFGNQLLTISGSSLGSGTDGNSYNTYLRTCSVTDIEQLVSTDVIQFSPGWVLKSNNAAVAAAAASSSFLSWAAGSYLVSDEGSVKGEFFEMFLRTFRLNLFILHFFCFSF